MLKQTYGKAEFLTQELRVLLKDENVVICDITKHVNQHGVLCYNILYIVTESKQG